MNISRYSRLVLSICTLYVTSTVTAQQNSQKMDSFINTLMSKMTLEEKIGQLNLVTGGEATTGSTVSTGVEGKIKSGAIGGIFSMSTPQRIRAAQDLAVKQSRLGIPLSLEWMLFTDIKRFFRFRSDWPPPGI